MSVNTASSVSMSDEDAKKEHDDIQREIAEKKGYKYEPESDKPPTEKVEIEKEPVKGKESDEDDEPEDPSAKKDKDLESPEDEDVDPEPEDDLKPRKKSLLGKYQSLKSERDTLKEANKAQAQKLEELTLALNKTQTAEKMKEKVSVFAEKHGMSEEAVMDLLLLQKEAIQPDPELRDTLEKSRTLILKDEAQKAFNTEFESLLEEIPVAAELRDKIQKEAYKKENLDKSLFEIYHRLNAATETEPAPKKRTGEAQRGAPSRENRAETFNARAVADKVKGGQSNALNGLTGEQADEVFTILEKDGSRYS